MLSPSAIWLGLVALSGCGPPTDPTPLGEDAVCDVLFGLPAENTGLPDDACAPVIQQDGEVVFAAEPVAPGQLEAWRSRTLSNPVEPLPTDPYLDPEAVLASSAPATAVCAIHDEGDAYRLETHDSVDAAREAGGRVTHGGACGACSSLQDLAVYAGTPDLTTPVRECGIEAFITGHDGNVACLEALGFSPACADIWARNTAYTREVCLDVCIELLSAPYHDADGEPNACIQCDEDEAGPVFKAVAGRTRRNSGLPTALCRPCGTVWRIDHSDGD
jgi:hypothetical protein